MLEQPGSSLLARHPRFQLLCTFFKEWGQLYEVQSQVSAEFNQLFLMTAGVPADLENMVLDGTLWPSMSQKNHLVEQ